MVRYKIIFEAIQYVWREEGINYISAFTYFV